MLKNFFKIARRNLFRNKSFAITNLLSLTVGITCTILIFMWVRDEVTHDKFNKNYENIHQVLANRDFSNSIFTDENMVLPLAKALEESSPQIKKAAAVTHRQENILEFGKVKIKKAGYTVSEHYFDIFSFKFLKGNASALNAPNSIILTESAVKAIFGNEDPLNKLIKINNSLSAKVAAVLADPPQNSSMNFDYLMPFDYSDPGVKSAMNEWVNSSWNVFILTAPGVDLKSLDKNINAIKKRHDKNDAVSTYFTFPMSKWHLYHEFKDGKNIGGMIEYVRLFSVIAIIILLIACINFMNLSTARSEERAREIGIRKTLGSHRTQLILQFFSESLVLTTIAFAVSIGIVYLLLPTFNLLVDKQLNLNIAEPVFVAGMIGIILFTGLIAGSYPALYLSSFKPVKVLKGAFVEGKKTIMPRRVLVVGQFVVSILLISATIIVYRQIQHTKNRDKGYNPDNLIMIPSTGDTERNFTVIKQELLKTGLINAATRSSSPITDIWWRSPGPDWDGKRADQDIIFAGLNADKDFSKTMGVKILEGKDFTGTPSDSSNMLLNKAAIDAMQLKNPVGKQLRYGGRNVTVIGVTGNIVMTDPYQAVDPMMIYYSPGGDVINIRLNYNVAPQKAVKAIETIFRKYNPAPPFEYQFVDEEFNKKFLSEERIGRITNVFAGLAIFICCIGLAGLASFTIEKRFREIGIRKVLGASAQSLLMLISSEFLKLVSVAFLIAVPLTWWLMYNWLQKYTYHTSISFWLFAIVGFVILLLTLIVVGVNTIKAIMGNVIKSLRTE